MTGRARGAPALPPEGRVLGVDPGTRRVGVAVSDAARRLATPLEVLERDTGSDRWLRRLAALAREWEVVGIVVGLPLSLDGSEGPAARAARALASEVAATTGLPVGTYDERLTTVTAARMLAGLDLSSMQRRRVVDQVAAAVMLQAWLDGARDAVPLPPQDGDDT